MDFNAVNERKKREYFHYLSEARGYTALTIQQAEVAISKFDDFLAGEAYSVYDSNKGVKFKEYLKKYVSPRSGKPLVGSMIKKTLKEVRSFLEWLADEPGYRSLRLGREAEYLTPAADATQFVGSVETDPIPTMDQLYQIVKAMPVGTVSEERDKGAVALIVLTGVRIDALISLKVKHLDFEKQMLHQLPEEGVRTKGKKRILTTFFPVDDSIKQAVLTWRSRLVDDLKFGPDDPLFPATAQAVGVSGMIENVGLSRQFWTKPHPVRDAYRTASARVGFTFKKPHDIRDALVALGLRISRTPEEFKAWSQNLGHAEVITTFLSYGKVADDRQAALILGLKNARPVTLDDPMVVHLREFARNMGFDLVPYRPETTMDAG